MDYEKFDQECVSVMGVPCTRVACRACKDRDSFFGIDTLDRAWKWCEAHVCGVKVTVPAAGFKFPEEPVRA